MMTINKIKLLALVCGLIFFSQNALAQSTTQPTTKTSTEDIPIVSVDSTATEPSKTTTKTVSKPKTKTYKKRTAKRPTTIQLAPNPVVVKKSSDMPTNYSSTATIPSANFMQKNKKMIGFSGMGFYEINSQFESLYVTFPTSNIKAAGFGFTGNFELGFNDRLSGEISMGYSRLSYANKFKNVIKQNFFTSDVVAHYYFLNNQKIAPYVIAGAGIYASSGSVAPTLDTGVGSHFKVADNLSIKTDLIYKTAIIHNRLEARVGLAFHF